MASARTPAAPDLPAGALRFADPVGSVIADRYRVLEHLSDGGMAAVYLAEHVAVGRKLALKILHPEQSCQPDVVRRFLQEARAASLVRNAHVVDVIDVGFTADGLAYMAMELLDGEDLATLLAREGPIAWARLGPMVLQICDALAAAHAHGIVHRDIKPENCFRTEFAGAQDFIKVLDFGIAKDLEGKVEGERPRTVSGSIYGTAAYVAPELLAGKQPDARVDIYALGVLMYELLSGHKPFPGEALSEILIGHLQVPPTPLSVKTSGRVGDEVDAVVLQALAKDPELRFQSMAELADAVAATLDPVVMQHAVEAGAIPSGPYLAVRREHSNPALNRPALAASKRSRRRLQPGPRADPRLYALAAVVGLILVAALGVLVWSWGARSDVAVAAPAVLAPAAAREPAELEARAPRHVAPPAPPVLAPATPDVAAPVARPTRLTAAAVGKEIQRKLAPRARACLTRHTRLIKGQQFPMRVEILPSGEARATATLATSPAARCIADLFQRHRFPANVGGLTLDHSFTP